MKHVSISSIAALVMMWSSAATAAPPQLKGQYAVTGHTTCQYSGRAWSTVRPNYCNGTNRMPCNNGAYVAFDPSTSSTNTTLFAWPLLIPNPNPNPGNPDPYIQASPNGVFSNSFDVVGVRTFDGQGNGTAKIRSVEVVNVSATPRSGSDDVTFKFTYTIDPAGGVTTQMVPGSYMATTLNLDGNPSATTWTLDRLSLTGLVGNNNSVLALATTLPEIESQTFLPGGPQAGQIQQRICVRSRTLIWMGN
jgi:hypothetical protein